MVTTQLKLGALACVVVLIASLAGLAFYYRANAASAAAERDLLRASLATATAANKAQEAALERLTATRALDDKMLAELQGRLGELATQTKQATTAIRDLERSNADVKAFLGGNLPDELRRVLNAPTDGKRPNDNQ